VVLSGSIDEIFASAATILSGGGVVWRLVCVSVWSSLFVYWEAHFIESFFWHSAALALFDIKLYDPFISKLDSRLASIVSIQILSYLSQIQLVSHALEEKCKII
jgi:small-conductance mechanosensitive channel